MTRATILYRRRRRAGLCVECGRRAAKRARRMNEHDDSNRHVLVLPLR